MIKSKKRIEKIFAISIVTVFMGQIYLSPFSTTFRFSLGVIVLSLLLIYFKNISIITTTNVVGICVFVFRSFVYMVSYPEVGFEEVISIYYPVGIFYILFGILFKILDIRNKLNKSILFIASLWFCDSISNMVEVFLRKEMGAYSFERVTLAIILIGMIRAIFTIYIYHGVLYYKDRYDREQREKKYRELIMLIANLKAELFFLRKSTIDIENAMNKSYELYEKLRESTLRDHALLIAKDIHEIKKDYIRVVTGIEKTLKEENDSLYMSIEEILTIIKGSTQKLIDMQDKKIILRLKYKHDFKTNQFYPLISILNNLIINAIEAIEDIGVITVIEKIDGDNCVFQVIDNGSGIEIEDMDLIFEPGFSTKFNMKTGEMSTGIGLTHVKHIIENHFNGKIHVESEKNKKTIFTVIIPMKTMIQGKM
ncbi:ATP-binding protein [Crassaminicella indica]|uniref:GHKL domain-containing protein n=1 Tax=Crassaminicella indica TaxID=2855394 RepID=A0ABX8R8U7_9CLOT|nr:ATP-binding protein [Crassaminicella indica]QXM05474.1 GHKL domain-containing protein [Crassaminicella indica]